MVSPDVVIKYVSNDRDHIKSLNNQHIEILKNQRALIRMGDAGNKSFRKVNTGANQFIGNLGKFTGAITGVGSVIGGIALAANQLFVEFRRIKELQQTDADRQVSFENALVKAVRNAGGFFGGEEVKKIALDLEDETGAAPTKIAESLSSAFSARGATNKQQAQEAVRATAASIKFAPDLSPEDTADLTGAGIDLSKRFGFTPEESLGFLKNVGSLARVVDPQKLSDQVAPAINNLADFGNTAQEAGSLVAALTQGSTDKNAARSATASIQLAAQLRARGIGESTTEGINILANDPELRKKFLEGGVFDGKKFPAASFEKRQLTAIEQLFQPGSVTRTAFTEGISQIGGKKEAQQAFDTSIAENNKVTLASRFRRESEAAAEASSIKDQAGGLAAEARNALNRAFDDANFSDARKKILIAEFEARSLVGNQSPFQVGESILEREQRRLLKETELVSAGTGGRGVEVKREVTDADKQSAAALRNQEEIFEKFNKEQQPRKEVKAKEVVPKIEQIKKPVKLPEIIERQVPLASVQNRNPIKEQPVVPINVKDNNQPQTFKPDTVQPPKVVVQKEPAKKDDQKSVKALEQNTQALIAFTKATEESNKLKAQEQQQKNNPQLTPPPRREPYRAPAESLSTTGG